jgi:large subunit ribosomal protein L5
VADTKETGSKEKEIKAKAADAPKPAKEEKKGKREKGALPNSLKMAAAGELKVSPESGMIRMEDYYRKTVVPSLMKQFAFKSVMQVPRIEKIVINCAVKEAIGNPKVLDSTMNDIMAISGQKPIMTRAKKAIAAFKVRKGNAVAVAVTLRRARMYEFYDRLVSVTLPRVRDFKGVSPKAFDGRGNYSLGIREQIIFPEVNYDTVDAVRGLTITIVTSAQTNEHARALLTEMGMPFRK